MVGVTALACGMIAVGSCNGDVTSTIVQTIMEKNEQELKDTYARWLPLGLGFNHLGRHGQRIRRINEMTIQCFDWFTSLCTSLDLSVCCFAMHRQRRSNWNDLGSSTGCARTFPQLCKHTGGHLCICRFVWQCCYSGFFKGILCVYKCKYQFLKSNHIQVCKQCFSYWLRP